MEICPHCKQEFKDIRALNIHVTVAHIAYKVAAIEEHLAALEKANQGSILGLIDTVNKSFEGIWKAINAQAAASFKRDNDLLEEIKVRDSTKHDQDIAHLQAKQSKKVKV